MKHQENIGGVFLLLFIHLKEIIELILSYNFHFFTFYRYFRVCRNLKCTIEIIRSWRPYHPQQTASTRVCDITTECIIYIHLCLSVSSCVISVSWSLALLGLHHHSDTSRPQSHRNFLYTLDISIINSLRDLKYIHSVINTYSVSQTLHWKNVTQTNHK